MNLREYLDVLRKRWVSIVALAVAGVVLAAMYTATKPNSYSATAESFIAISTSVE